MKQILIVLFLATALVACGGDNEVNPNSNLLNNQTLNPFGNGTGTLNIQTYLNIPLRNMGRYSYGDDLTLRNTGSGFIFFRYDPQQGSVQGTWLIQGKSIVLLQSNGQRYGTASEISYNGRKCLQFTKSFNTSGNSGYPGGYGGGYPGGYGRPNTRIATFCRGSGL
jgi:hypothetical protein